MNCSIQSVSRPYLRHLFVHVPDFTAHPKKRLLIVKFRRNRIMSFVNVLDYVCIAMNLVVKKAEICFSETSEKAYCLSTA